MSRNRIALFGVLGVVVGLMLGVFGRDFIVANERQKLEAQKVEIEARVQAQEHSNKVTQPSAKQGALIMVASMRDLQSALKSFIFDKQDWNGNPKEVIDFAKAFDTPEHIKSILEKYMMGNLDIYLHGGWSFLGTNDSNVWIGFDIDVVDDPEFMRLKPEIIQKLLEWAQRYGLYKAPNAAEGLYNGGNLIYMKVQ